MMNGKVAEIFHSIQGEGLYQGAGQVFIRLYGCNLHCAFCDTPLGEFREMSADELCAELEKYPRQLPLSLTGGEPLLQAEFAAEVLRLVKHTGRQVHLETNGTLPDEFALVEKYVDFVAMDFKLPSSARCGTLWERHRDFLDKAKAKPMCVKTVIGPRTRFRDVARAVELIRAAQEKIPLILQPQHPYEERLESRLFRWAAACESRGVETRIIGQLHAQLGIR
ncbi:MAG: radical SAM protein [Candidatus Omnitrophica bacterium]|nr:radical SAM protein [Candidatus Omnitrophota bacterium]